MERLDDNLETLSIARVTRERAKCEGRPSAFYTFSAFNVHALPFRESSELRAKARSAFRDNVDLTISCNAITIVAHDSLISKKRRFIVRRPERQERNERNFRNAAGNSREKEIAIACKCSYLSRARLDLT